MNNVNFGSATRIYFFTNDGKRIVSDENIGKCERYVSRNLNNASNLKERNMDLVRSFVYDKNQGTGNRDYYNYPKVRTRYGYENKHKNGNVSLIAGYNDLATLRPYEVKMGLAQKEARTRIGSTKSYEVERAIENYNRVSQNIENNRGIYKDGERQAFKVVFEPKYKRNGEFKGFEYQSSGYFNESDLNELA